MKVLILGIGGQDGSYLAEEMCYLQHEVHGVVRRSSVDNIQRIQHLGRQINLLQGDLLDTNSIARLIYHIKPDEIYNLADQDNVGFSWATPGYSADVTAGAVFRLLDAILWIHPKCRVFQACSATMFGDAPPPQNEQTPLNPLSPYACAKAAAYHACRYFRQVRGLNVWTGILYNHDSPRRKPGHLLATICQKAKAVAGCGRKTLELGCLDQRVDVGYALEYVQAMYNLLQRSDPGDFVIGTGVGHTIRKMAEAALDALGIEDTSLVVENPYFDNSASTHNLIADASKIRALYLQPVTDSLALVRHYLRSEECE